MGDEQRAGAVRFFLRHAMFGAFEWSFARVEPTRKRIAFGLLALTAAGISIPTPAIPVDWQPWRLGGLVMVWFVAFVGSIYDEHKKLRAALDAVERAQVTPAALDPEAALQDRFEKVRDLANNFQRLGYNQLHLVGGVRFEHNWPARAELFLQDFAPSKVGRWRAARREKPDMTDVTTNVWQNRQRIHGDRKGLLFLKRFAEIVETLTPADVSMRGNLEDAIWHIDQTPAPPDGPIGLLR